MVESGFEVSVCSPRGHSLALVEGLTGSYRLRRLGRSRSMLRAIRLAQPDIILPDDEQTLKALRRLYGRVVRSSDAATAAVLARSLGDVDEWPSITSRAGLAHAAESLGVTAPRTDVVTSVADVCEWVDRNGLPLVLKTDGSWGGRGVAVVGRASALCDRWQRMAGPPAFPRSAKRLLVNLDTDPITAWLRRARPVVNSQKYVWGGRRWPRSPASTARCSAWSAWRWSRLQKSGDRHRWFARAGHRLAHRTQPAGDADQLPAGRRRLPP
jgi:hypothetical protein